MNIKECITSYFENNSKKKYMFLQGYLSGSPVKYYEASMNVTSLWNFSKNPVLTNYSYFDTVYFIISRFKNKNEHVKNLYNIQAVYQLNNKGANLLQIGCATLLDNVLKIGLLENTTCFGDIYYNSNNNIFTVYRYSNNSDSLITDNGEYKVIPKKVFEENTGIKIN